MQESVASPYLQHGLGSLSRLADQYPDLENYRTLQELAEGRSNPDHLVLPTLAEAKDPAQVRLRKFPNLSLMLEELPWTSAISFQ